VQQPACAHIAQHARVLQVNLGVAREAQGDVAAALAAYRAALVAHPPYAAAHKLLGRSVSLSLSLFLSSLSLSSLSLSLVPNTMMLTSARSRKAGRRTKKTIPCTTQSPCYTTNRASATAALNL
jgi:hypothetical protein